MRTTASQSSGVLAAAWSDSYSYSSDRGPCFQCSARSAVRFRPTCSRLQVAMLQYNFANLRTTVDNGMVCLLSSQSLNNHFSFQPLNFLSAGIRILYLIRHAVNSWPLMTDIIHTRLNLHATKRRALERWRTCGAIEQVRWFPFSTSKDLGSKRTVRSSFSYCLTVSLKKKGSF